MDTVQQIVMVPVPADRLQEVYGLLAAKPATLGTVTGELEVRFTTDYSASEIALLKEHLRPDGAARKMLDLCAASPDQLVGFDEVAMASECTENVARGQFGALTKVIKRLFDGKKSWPVTTQFMFTENGAQAYYRMSPAHADAWRNARGGNDGRTTR